VDAAQRKTYLDACGPVVERARHTPGCADMAISADLVDPARVNIYERWTSRTALEDFRTTGPEFEQFSMIRTMAVDEYDAAAERSPFSSSED
jgi:quinol monooxygenase YgiN